MANNITAVGGTFIYATKSIPVLAGQAASIIDTATFGQLGLSDLIGASPVKWGVFTLDGEAIAVTDTVATMEYTKATRISNYPLEEGGFAACNKVDEPFYSRVTLIRGGSESDRADFIAALDAAASSLQLFNILMPETTYFNVSVERFDFRRTVTNGVGMIFAELTLVEVRESATAEYSSPISPDAQTPRAQGQLQPAPPDVSESALARIGSMA